LIKDQNLSKKPRDLDFEAFLLELEIRDEMREATEKARDELKRYRNYKQQRRLYPHYTLKILNIEHRIINSEVFPGRRTLILIRDLLSELEDEQCLHAERGKVELLLLFTQFHNYSVNQ